MCIRDSVWSIGVIFYLQNMGVQMAAIWALLSAGGIGAGLALKEPVQEFFEYITILLDKIWIICRTPKQRDPQRTTGNNHITLCGR